MADGYLNFDTKINTAGFNKGIASIGKMVQGAGSAVSNLGKAFTPVSLAVAGVGAAAVKTTIDFTKLYESTMVVFEKMLGGKQAANELYGSLLSIAKASTFSQEAFLTAGKKLVGMGIDAQSTTKYMQAITDAVAGFGGTSENLTNVAENFAKISTAGRLSMEDVNMLSDNGINALKILGNQYGVTTDKMRDMISDGSIPAKDAMDKLAEGIENGTDGVNGMTAAMAGMSLAMKGKTLTGALDSLNSGFRGFALNLTGINPTLKETDAGYAESTQRLQQLTAAISTIAGVLPSAAKVFSSLTDGIGKLLDKLVGANIAFDEATGTWKNVEGVLGSLKEKLDTMNPEKLKSIGDAILAMAAAGIGLPILGGGLSKVGGAIEAVSGVVAPAEKAIAGLPDSFKNTASKIAGSAKSFGNLKDAILLPIQDIGSKMGGFLGGMSELWTSGPGGKLTSLVSGRVKEIGGAIAQMGPELQKTFPRATNALQGFTSYVGAWGGTVGESMSGVVKSLAGFAPGFINMLKFGAIVGAVVAGLGLLQSNFGTEISSFLQMAIQKGPEIITNFCNGITSALPNLIAQGAILVNNLLQAIIANIPAIISGGIQIISGLVIGIAQQLPTLIPMALQMILTIVQSLLSNIPQLINAGIQLLVGLAQGILNSIPMLISAIPSIIQSLVSGILQNLPTIILVGIQLLVALVLGVIQAIPQLLSMIPQIFQAFAEGIMSINWLEVGKQILTAIIDGIKSIGTGLWDAIKGIFEDGEEGAKEKGKNAGEKYAQGVDESTATAQMSAYNFATATTNSYATGMDANGFLVNSAALNMGNNASNGLQLANVPGAFSTNAQAAAGAMTGTFDANAMIAGTAAQTVGNSANAGISNANMGAAFSAAGSSAGQGLRNGISGQSGAVAGAAGAVAGVAQSSMTKVNLNSSYTNAGKGAMQGLTSSISSGTSSVNSAAKAAGTAVVSGLTSAQMPQKARAEATTFVNSLVSTIRSGSGAASSATSTLINAAKSAVSGLGGAGLSAGAMFSAGIASGIRSGQSNISAAAAQVANAAAQAAKANLDIHSPSKVGDWIGRMFDLGVANGIVRNTKQVTDSGYRMTSALSSGTEAALMSLQRQADIGTSSAATRAYGQNTKAYLSQNNTTGLLDEWERRQRKINNERDTKPVLLNGRQINRALAAKGDFTA